MTMLDNITLELISRGPPPGATERPPLLFLHGAFCGAWVWDEHFLGHFAQAGYPAYALSFRGHGASAGRLEIDRFGLHDAEADAAAAIARLGRPPVLVGHSLGGFIAQRLLGRVPLAGLALLASVPPDGLASVQLRLAFISPRVWGESLATVLAPETATPERFRRAMLDDGTADETVLRAYHLMEPESRRLFHDANHAAAWVSARITGTPVLVMGAAADRLIGADAVARTSLFHGGALAWVEGAAHALMLSHRWPDAAMILERWLTGLESG